MTFEYLYFIVGTYVAYLMLQKQIKVNQLELKVRLKILCLAFLFILIAYSTSFLGLVFPVIFLMVLIKITQIIFEQINS